MTEALDVLCREAGVTWQYRDGAGRPQEAPPESRIAVLAAMGLPAQTEEQAAETLAALSARKDGRIVAPWLVVDAAEPVRIPLGRDEPVEWRLALEDGETRQGEACGQLDAGLLEAGRHVLEVGGQATVLLSAPRQLPLPARGWGVTLPLYGLRPEGGGEIGTYGDLERAGTALAAHGASFVGINPVHAGFPHDPSNYSPYAPSSRRRLNTNLIETGAEPKSADGGLIDYNAALRSKTAALKALYAAIPGDPAFQAFVDADGRKLREFAVHQALSETFGPYWTDWPREFQSPQASAVGEFANANPELVRYHMWLQWRAEAQLSRAQLAARDAGMRHGLYLDLAVGTHPAGAETWADAEMFASGISLGAPPDAFSAEGQVWGVSPFCPRALVDNAFDVLAETLREQFKFSGMLRIDHILGFERAFWCPEDLPGVYVAMPKAAMLAVLRIEASRAGAFVVGEDLGNIPDELRSDLAASGILGCRVAMFERDWDGDRGFKPGDRYDSNVLSSFASHDLPTWRGWRSGLDIAWRNRIGDLDEAAAREERERRRWDVHSFDAASGGDGSVERMHAFLAGVPSCLVALQVEDVLGVGEQANLPGTQFEHPNWRRRLPVSASGLATDERFRTTAGIMAESSR